MRVLVCLLAGLGDAIMASPMIRAIKSQRPDARIETISALASVRDYASGNPDVDSAEHEDFLDYTIAHKLVKLLRLRARSYDYTILPYPARRWHYHAGALVLAAGKLVAHRYRGFQRYVPGYRWQEPVTYRHQSELNLALLPALGLAQTRIARYTFPERWQLASDPPVRREIAFHLSTGHSPISKGNELKAPSMQFYAQMMRLLSERGYAISAVGSGPELAMAPILEKMSGTPVNLIAGSLREVADELRRVQCVVAPDSGIGHLAAAVGTQVFSVFGITDPVTFAPLGDVRVYRPSVCKPCFEMSDQRFKCKRSIDVACLNRDLVPEHALRDLLAFVERGRVKPAVRGGIDVQDTVDVK